MLGGNRNMEWQRNTSRLRTFLPDVSPKPLGMYLSRPSLVELHPRTGVGLFRSTVHRWGMVSTAACEYGAEKQTVDPIIAACPNFLHPNRGLGLKLVDEKTGPG